MDDLERQVAERLWYTVARIAHPLTSGSVTATLARNAAGLAALKGGDDA